MADKLLKSIKFPTLPDRYIIGDSTLTEEGAAAEAKAVGEALATKADTKGRYENIVAGGAEQLMADGYETDKEPYLFRTTGGSADVGNREYLDKIVGGTVAWNQLFSTMSTDTKDGITTSYDSTTHLISIRNDSRTANYSSGSSRMDVFSVNDMLQNHVYLIAPSKMIKGVVFAQGLNCYAVKNINYPLYIRITSEYDFVSAHPIGDVTSFYLNIIDLTALFANNPAIADYIYSLEQSQAGAGVAWFRNYFPNDYYPYDPGTLRSVEGVSAHETVGFNQWDEEWRNGYYSNTGEFAAYQTCIANKNHIRVTPGATYYFMSNTARYSAGMRIVFRDSDGATLSSTTINGNVQFDVPENCYYIDFSTFAVTGVTTYNNDICINLSDPTRNGEYEPYQKHTYSLDSSLTLRGVPKLVDGKLAYDGDIYLPSGEVQRRYGIVDLGTLNWTYGTWGGHDQFNATLTDAKSNGAGTLANMLSSAYSNVTPNNFYTGGADGTMTLNSTTIRIANSNYTDAASFKAAMSGVYLVYELATPTTETADPFEPQQTVDPSGTERFVSTGIVPVGHETRYPHDLKKKIETAPDSPSTDGTYLMKRSGGKNAYMALPSTPSSNGAYVLTLTVSGGNATYSWIEKE